eukprot:g5468.t1
MAGTNVSPEDVIKFTKPTSAFLCEMDANVYGIDFISFIIKNYDTKEIIFKVDREDSAGAATRSLAALRLREGFDPDTLRKIDYNFDADVLSLPRVSTKLKFTVGNNEVHKFRMIERHYFRNKLIKSFDFTFPFCMPNSENLWESEYDLPPMDSEMIDDIVSNPWQVMSDSFYFVDGELIMHNKARYRYFYSKAREAKLAGGDMSSDDEEADSRPRNSTNSKLMDSDDEESDEDETYAAKISAYERRGK